MTGEMSCEEVTRESFPLHFAIADAFNGTVEPFDQYQGPYVLANGQRFWIINDGYYLAVYLETTHRQSEWIPPFKSTAALAGLVADAARDLSNGGGFDPDNGNAHDDAMRLVEIGEGVSSTDTPST